MFLICREEKIKEPRKTVATYKSQREFQNKHFQFLSKKGLNWHLEMQTSILQNYEKRDCWCVVFSIISTLLKLWPQKINPEQQKVRSNDYYMIGKLYFIFFFLILFFYGGGDTDCPGTFFVDQTLSQIQRDSPALPSPPMCWDKKNVPPPPSMCFISYIINNKTQNQPYHYSVQYPGSTVK